MRLITFTLEGFRRFEQRTSLKLHGPMIALIGPNEAGKSTILEALELLNSDDAIPAGARSRRTQLDPSLEWRFQLEPSDKTAIAAISEAKNVQSVIITKGLDGVRHWQFRPENPVRDLGTRRAVSTMMAEVHNGKQFKAIEQGEYSTVHLFEQVKALLTENGDYADDQIVMFRDLADSLDTSEPFARVKLVAALPASLRELAESESEPSPYNKAVETLKPLLPSMERFRQEDRGLLSQYDLTSDAANPPLPLRHLVVLADLKLKPLLRDVQEGRIADVTTAIARANRRLLEVFAMSWNQQGVAIQFDVHNTILHIQATTPGDDGVSDIAERSDGMRWFAALLAFSHEWKDLPILLVDELETHLHYDAQADLIDVLAKQLFTSKVIYTTHSFGCLPHDLGTGVRVVEQVDERTSRLENGFWKGGAGFSPLMASMGAAAVSFTPTRYALIAEGAADAILLPTLLREALNLRALAFQVAPGLSIVAASRVPELEAEAGRVAFVVDNDEGGKDRAKLLRDAGIAEHRILMLPGKEPTEIEDLVDPGVYVKAVNDEMGVWASTAKPVDVSDLGDSRRTKALVAWCKSNGYSAPDKMAVAQRVIDESGLGAIIAKRRKRDLVTLYRRIQKALNL